MMELDIAFNIETIKERNVDKYVTILPARFKLNWAKTLFKNSEIINCRYIIDGTSEYVKDGEKILWENLYQVSYKDSKAINNYDDQAYTYGSAIARYDLIVHVQFEQYLKILYCVKKWKPKRHKKQYTLPAGSDRYSYFMYNDQSYYVSKTIAKYMNITNENYRITEFQTRKTLNNRIIIEICYDVETLPMSGKHQPYLLYAVWNGEKSFGETQDFYYELENKENLTKSEAGKKFVEWIMRFEIDSNLWRYEMHIFGYNSDRFDLNFIVEEFRKYPNIKMNNMMREGKITEFYAEYNGLVIRFKDIFKYIPDMGLKDACTYYGVSDQKMDVDIVKYNNLSKDAGKLIQSFALKADFESCLKGANVLDKIKLGRKYLNAQTKEYEIYRLIKDYCKADVIATMALFNVIQSSYIEIITAFEKKFEVEVKYRNIFEYISVPSMAFYMFKLIAKKEKSKHVIFQSHDVANYIYQSFIGGRTCFSLVGICKIKDFGYYDIRSQYPLVMKGLYPFVESKDDILFGCEIDYELMEEEIEEIARQRNFYMFEKNDFDNVTYFKQWDKKKGVYMCTIMPPEDNTQLLACFSPIAQRVYENNMQDKKLVYFNRKQEHRILNSDHIKALIYGGWSIVFERHKNDIQFLKADYIFKSYVEFFSYYKTKAKEDGNKALAKWSKGLLNYLYGKTCLSPTSTNTSQVGENTNGVYDCASFKFEKDSWKESLHYLATFITAQGNWVSLRIYIYKKPI